MAISCYFHAGGLFESTLAMYGELLEKAWWPLALKGCFQGRSAAAPVGGEAAGDLQEAVGGAASGGLRAGAH